MSGIMWLASYPKSGNTWMRVLLTNYVRDPQTPACINDLEGGPIASSRPWFDHWVGIEASALPRSLVDQLRPEVYRRIAADATSVGFMDVRFMKVHDAWRRVNGGKPMFPPEVTAGVIYIVRNPLDLVVSCADHWGSTLESTVDRLCTGTTDEEPDDWLDNQLPQRLGSWSEHVDSWVRHSELAVTLVRYEDLLNDTHATFTSVVNAAYGTVDERRLAKAVRFSQFSELQRQEVESGFKERSASARGAFFRRGEVGSWRHELPANLASRIRSALGREMRELGYDD
ncbi:MAG: sulfotransferase domain-containing protein [Acidimicrobiales bacterium]